MKQGYKTRQKEQILQYLISRSGQHITAQEISRHLADAGTPVGTATIYRTLEQLADDGTLRKYTIDSRTSACYEYVPETQGCNRHFHLKCMQCGTLFHVTCEHLNSLESHISEHHGFQIDQSRTVLYGVREKCRKEKT